MYRIGKSSFGRIRFRFMVFFTILFLPYWWFCNYHWGDRYGFFEYWASVLWVWACWQAGAFFVVVFLGGISVRAICHLVYGGDPDYLRWLEAGGDAFYDNPLLAANSDPVTVKMAIGYPPKRSHCVCGQALGQNFGNRCGVCGRYWDNY